MLVARICLTHGDAVLILIVGLNQLDNNLVSEVDVMDTTSFRSNEALIIGFIHANGNDG